MRRLPTALTAALLPLTLAACAMQPAPEIATPTPDLPPAFFFKPEGGTSAGLAEPASRHDHPDAPIARRCALLAAREQLPVKLEFSLLLVVEGIGDERAGFLLVLVHPLEIGAQRAPSARARSCLSRRRISSTLRSIEARTSAALTLRCCAIACEAVSRCAASKRIALAKS